MRRLASRVQYTCRFGPPNRTYCQFRAMPLVSGVRGKPFNSARSAAISGESNAGGGPGRSWLPDESTHGFQSDSSALTAAGPVHFWPTSVGITQVPLASKLSLLARSTAAAPTARPSSRPAATSLGYCTPAMTRVSPASSAIWPSDCASFGKRWARMTEAAPAAVACSHGYEGVGETATAVLSDGSIVLGRGRLLAYLARHAAISASYIAALVSANTRAAWLPERV